MVSAVRFDPYFTLWAFNADPSWREFPLKEGARIEIPFAVGPPVPDSPQDPGFRGTDLAPIENEVKVSIFPRGDAAADELGDYVVAEASSLEGQDRMERLGFFYNTEHCLEIVTTIELGGKEPALQMGAVILVPLVVLRIEPYPDRNARPSTWAMLLPQGPTVEGMVHTHVRVLE
jgi:hypothetical protein